MGPYGAMIILYIQSYTNDRSFPLSNGTYGWLKIPCVRERWLNWLMVSFQYIFSSHIFPLNFCWWFNKEYPNESRSLDHSRFFVGFMVAIRYPGHRIFSSGKSRILKDTWLGVNNTCHHLSIEQNPSRMYQIYAVCVLVSNVTQHKERDEKFGWWFLCVCCCWVVDVCCTFCCRG